MKKRNLVLLIAAAIALLGSVLYLLLDRGDRTFSWLAFGLALGGAVITLLPLKTKLAFAPILPTALYAAAFGLVLRVALPSLSDVWNGVNFIGGNAVLGMTFAGVYLLCGILGCIACFMNGDVDPSR
ncbi:MAG: hypothetical protein IJL59_08720 [Clostridia bacterium]|nr:hypothetical protein [Clostridia bacterium]